VNGGRHSSIGFDVPGVATAWRGNKVKCQITRTGVIQVGGLWMAAGTDGSQSEHSMIGHEGTHRRKNTLCHTSTLSKKLHGAEKNHIQATFCI
jgi:hypothetical protein